MLNFIIGLAIGTIVGFVFASLFAVSNCADCHARMFAQRKEQEK